MVCTLNDCKFVMAEIWLVESEKCSRLVSRWKGPSIFSMGGVTPISLISLASDAFRPLASSHFFRACLIVVGMAAGGNGGWVGRALSIIDQTKIRGSAETDRMHSLRERERGGGGSLALLTRKATRPKSTSCYMYYL